MKLLRYLDLSYNTHIEELPNSLANLHNLQGLNLEGCTYLRKWPSDISKLVNLTDLNNRGCVSLNYIPSGIRKLTKLEKLSEFVLAEGQPVLEHAAELDELHSLDNLRGELDIKNLRSVENAASEIREGLLSLKQNLQVLSLYWGFYGSDDVAHEELVMEALCPHPNLKVLNVFHYMGVKAPSWLPSVTYLVEFTIKYCSSIERIPPLDQLPHLKVLNISHMSKLEGIQVANRGGSSLFFPSLTHLTLSECGNLTGFERPSTQELPCFPCLSYLYVLNCPDLTRWPLSPGPEMCYATSIKLSSKRLEVWNYIGENPPLWLTFVTNLVAVTLKFFSTPRLPPFDQLPHLQTLQILNSEVESIEIEKGGGSSLFFPSLIHLTLNECPNLKGFERLSSEELPCFPRLSKLSIWSCPNLIHLPLSPELEHLKWTGAKSLIEIFKMPTNAASTLSKLQDLRISIMKDWTENELNDGIPWQSLEALRSVSLSSTEELIALPKGLQYATSLQHLVISNWWSLACMPEWMPKLVALQDLTVRGCPQLEERCNTDSAVDWPYISHIPNITIHGKQIQRDGHYLL